MVFCLAPLFSFLFVPGTFTVVPTLLVASMCSFALNDGIPVGLIPEEVFYSVGPLESRN